MKRKKMSRKASHAAKHAPSYCEMWFVNKGKLICTRQASESSSSTLSNSDRNEAETSAAGVTVSAGLLSVENLWDPVYSESASSRNRSSFSECTTSSSSTSSFSGWRGDKPNDDSNQRTLAGFVADASGLPEFSLSDLETATCNFSDNFCVGKGSYGTVYKGELVGKTVAVKKLHSYNMQRQTEFHKIAQVFAKIRNPQVVDLIGVCPGSLLLVYEYLPGGSLKNHLFNNNIYHLNWKARTRMVADIATGLLFLHSFEPEKIVHGNLNPSNILLNSEYRCKISDCGDHMLVTSQTLRCPSFRHCTGSSCDFGYTDPEFHRTGMLTHKSDIYSFGLIILQLVTGKMLGGLVAQVRRAVSIGKVASILDLSAGDWCGYVARRLVELGLQCCGSSGRDRPEMTPSLVEELDRLNILEEQTVPSFFLCPILQEIMHDPQVAADGFTYEGDALRGWLGNGHETSPMTNLKLSHLNLTPNNALKLAIQEWLRKS